MAEANGSQEQSGAVRYLTKFQPEQANGFRAAMSRLAPGCGSRRLVPWFDGRATPPQIADWLSGRRNVPQWAIDLINAKLAARYESERQATAQIKTGPGSAKAGAYALARWRASRRRAT